QLEQQQVDQRSIHEGASIGSYYALQSSSNVRWWVPNREPCLLRYARHIRRDGRALSAVHRIRRDLTLDREECQAVHGVVDQYSIVPQPPPGREMEVIPLDAKAWVIQRGIDTHLRGRNGEPQLRKDILKDFVESGRRRCEPGPVGLRI